MPSTTTNLGLYKKNPSTDGNDTFDITTMLNDNWDRLDAQLGAQIADAAPTTVNLVNGLQVVDVPQTAPLENLRITGRTLVNLLGRDGNCEDVGKWSVFQSTQTLNTANNKYGNNSIKVTATSANYAATCRNNISLPSGNKYLVLAEFNVGTAPYAAIEVTPAIGVSNGITTTTGFGLAYKKFISTGLVGINLYTIATAAGQFFYVDGVRLYALSDAEYSAIDGMTAAQIAAKYPYVDDVKHINAPYVIKYEENLLPPFNEWTSTNGAIPIISPYNSSIVKFNSSSVEQIVSVPILSGQTYTFSAPVTISNIGGTIDVGAYYNLTAMDSNGVSLGDMNTAPYATTNGTTTLRKTFTTPIGTASLRVVLGVTTATGKFTLDSPRLNIGTADKGFKPRNDDMLAFPNVRLAASADGSVFDTLLNRDGKYFVEKRFRDVVLDGSLAWLPDSDYTGFKRVKIPLTGGSNPSAFTQFLTKYDGKIVKWESLVNSATDVFAYDTDNNFVYITIADTDSGWGETYIPTTQEIQAYFYGWYMSNSTASSITPYNGTGSKTWWPRGTNGFPVQGANVYSATLPTTQAVNFPTYNLTYQLATPTFEEIQVDGSMSLHKGLNQIEVGQGVVVREKANVFIGGLKNYINAQNTASLYWLSKYTTKILGVYKNGKLDSHWSIQQNTFNGRVYAYGAIEPSNFDPTATYEASYIGLDQHLFSAPVQAVTGEVASNLKTVVDTLSNNQVDIARISATEVLARQIHNVPQKTNAAISLYVDATNGTDNNDGSAGKPLKTIQRAINSVPQIINHAVNIYVSAGTYAEDVLAQDLTGQMTITAINTAQGTTNVNSISFLRCKGRFSATGFTATTTSRSAFLASYSNAAIFDTCFITTVSSSMGFEFTTSIGRISGGTASNRGTGIYANFYSHVQVSNVSGTGNTGNGICADQGAIITIYANPLPSGSIPLYTTLGGMIIPVSGVLNPWGDNTFGTRPASRAMGSGSTGQAISASVWTKVQFPVENFDNLGSYDSATLFRFTAPSAGIYHIDTNVLLTGIAVSTTLQLSIYLNGAHYRRLDYFLNVSSASAYELKGNASIYLGAGDYIEIYINSSTAITLAFANDINFEVVRIA